MAADLTSRHCKPCEGGIPALSKSEVAELSKRVLEWKVAGDGKSIRRVWKAKAFVAAMAFFDRVATLAESEGHHPDLHLTGYRNAAIELTTHAIDGLSENDFILAAKIDELPIELKD